MNQEIGEKSRMTDQIETRNESLDVFVSQVVDSLDISQVLAAAKQPRQQEKTEKNVSSEGDSNALSRDGLLRENAELRGRIVSLARTMQTLCKFRAAREQNNVHVHVDSLAPAGVPVASIPCKRPKRKGHQIDEPSPELEICDNDSKKRRTKPPLADSTNSATNS